MFNYFEIRLTLSVWFFLVEGYLLPLKFKLIKKLTIFKGNAQFIFFCNPQKSSVNVYLMKILRWLVGLKLIQLKQQKTQLPLIILAKNLKPVLCRIIKGTRKSLSWKWILCAFKFKRQKWRNFTEKFYLSRAPSPYGINFPVQFSV